MKPLIKSNWFTITGLLLSLPAALLISVSVLKYVFNINEPFDSIQPTVETWGIKEAIGWNINLLIFLGPVIGFLLAVFQVLQLKWNLKGEQFEFHFTIKKKWFALFVAGFCVSILAVLFLYMLGENCNC